MADSATILLATDFSAASERARDRALEMARAMGARLLIVHTEALVPYTAGGPDLVILPAGLESRLRDAAKAQLAEWAELATANGVQAEFELAEGRPASGTLAVAKERGVDWIVTGTRGIIGFRHLLLGSTAEAIVRGAPCPVLTVHPGHETPLEQIRTAVLPTDFSEGAAQAIEHATALLSVLGHPVRLVLVHAYHLPMVTAPHMGVLSLTSVVLTEARERALEALAPVASELRSRGFEVEALVREGDSATVVTMLAEEVKAGLIALGTRGFSKTKQVVLGSTAERVVQHAPCPVLTVRCAESADG